MPFFRDFFHKWNIHFCRQAYCNIMAGAAFCLGLRFAGTQSEEANTVLDRIFEMFLHSWNGSYFNACAGKPTLETCLMLVLLATSMVCRNNLILKIIR